MKKPLVHSHFGDSGPTVEALDTVIDTRAAVGHLTRNIKIVSGGDTSWGFRLFVYKYTACTTPRTGSITLEGVELINGGNDYQSKPAIEFYSVSNSSVSSTISKSSIHHCNYKCLTLQNVKNISISDNVIATGKRFLV